MLKAQPRLIVLLGIVPPAAAVTYAALMKDDRGYIVAGLLLGTVTAFFAIQAVLHKMKAAHWGMLAGLAFVAITINTGAPVRAVALSFGSLLAVAVLALKGFKDNKQRLLAGLIALFVWLGTANAPGMDDQHATAEAGVAELGVLVQDRASELLERLTHGNG